MNFFWRRKRLIVDAFTCESPVHDFFPIRKAGAFIPDWWKRAEKEITCPHGNFSIKQSTIKRCEGLIGAYGSGFIIPLWSELRIKTTEEGGYDYLWASQCTPGPSVVSHEDSQFGGFDHGHINAKIISPWAISEKSGIKFMWLQPTWNRVSSIFTAHIIPGALEFKVNKASHINMFLPKKNMEHVFDPGEPIAHLVPLTEKKVEIRNHLVTPQEYERFYKRINYMSSFSGSYRKILKASNA